MSYVYIDDLDIKILSILLKDSRTPYRKIARTLGVGESTIYLRIKKLKEAGILNAFTIDIDLRRLGLVAEALMMIKVRPRNYSKILNKVTGVPGVIEAYEITGEYQLAVKVVAKNNESLSRIIDELGSIEGIDHVKVLYVIRSLVGKMQKESVLEEVL
jgi:Lrp/AsnC family transcriptional regulator for asnA, asnC and gidA